MTKQHARTSPEGGKKKAKASEALLVCACEEDEKFTGICLEGAAPLKGFKKKVVHLPKDREVVFHCAGSRAKGATARTREYAAKGSEKVMVLGKRLKGWSKAVYPEVSEYLWNWNA